MSLDLQFTILVPGGGTFRLAEPFSCPAGQCEQIQAVMCAAMAPGLITDLPSDPSRREPLETAIQVFTAPARYEREIQFDGRLI